MSQGPQILVLVQKFFFLWGVTSILLEFATKNWTSIMARYDLQPPYILLGFGWAQPRVDYSRYLWSRSGVLVGLVISAPVAFLGCDWVDWVGCTVRKQVDRKWLKCWCSKLRKSLVGSGMVLTVPGKNLCWKCYFISSPQFILLNLK